jgi:hypothetical protein
MVGSTHFAHLFEGNVVCDRKFVLILKVVNTLNDAKSSVFASITVTTR